MAQVLKHELDQRMRSAALEVFAERGYVASSMADIARRAGISTGNVYRYYESKEALFSSVIPEALAKQLLSLLRRRVRALSGVRNVFELSEQASFHSVAEELLRFAVAHRLEVVVLLARTEGTVYTGFADRLVKMLERLALHHFRELAPARKVDTTTRFVLRQIYESFVRTLVRILQTYHDETAIRGAVQAYSRYHLAGLNQLFGETVESQITQKGA